MSKQIQSCSSFYPDQEIPSDLLSERGKKDRESDRQPAYFRPHIRSADCQSEQISTLQSQTQLTKKKSVRSKSPALTTVQSKKFPKSITSQYFLNPLHSFPPPPSRVLYSKGGYETGLVHNSPMKFGE